MSKEIITKFGQAVKVGDHIVKVNHVASKQKYVICKKDAAQEPESFPREYEDINYAVYDTSFQAGELVIHSPHGGRNIIIHITTKDTFKTIVEKLVDTDVVFARIINNDGMQIVLESKRTGIDKTFDLTGGQLEI